MTPDGKAPEWLTTDTGDVSLHLTVKVLDEPLTKRALSTLVIAGAALRIKSVKLCTASGETPFVAVMLNVKLAGSPKSGIPRMLAVPSVLSTKASHSGTVPEILKVEVGRPVVRTVNTPSTPSVKVVLAVLRNPGARGIGTAAWTVSVKA